MSVLKFIRKSIKQFRLHQYQEAEILNESYERAVKAIDQGGEITNIPGWIRSTSFNIIREKKDKEVVQTRLTEKLQSSTSTVSDAPLVSEDPSINGEISKLVALVESLDFDSQRLLYMRDVEQLSWKKIKERLNSNIADAALRQRYSRLKKKIRSGL